MTIAEKLARAKTDIDEVYEKGHEVGYDNGYAKCESDVREYVGIVKSWDSLIESGALVISNNQLSQGTNSSTLDGELVIPERAGVKSIGAGAFQGNTTITKVTLPNSVNIISGSAFRGCMALESITFASGDNTGNLTISTYAFGDCSALKTITLPARLQTVHSATFYNCTSLENIYFEGTIRDGGLNLSSSTKLSKASWENIVGSLASWVSSSITGSLASVNTAFETSAGAGDGSTSEEWLNLIATKPNWTINLV